MEQLIKLTVGEIRKLLEGVDNDTSLEFIIEESNGDLNAVFEVYLGNSSHVYNTSEIRLVTRNNILVSDDYLEELEEIKWKYEELEY